MLRLGWLALCAFVGVKNGHVPRGEGEHVPRRHETADYSACGAAPRIVK